MRFCWYAARDSQSGREIVPAAKLANTTATDSNRKRRYRYRYRKTTTPTMYADQSRVSKESASPTGRAGDEKEQRHRGTRPEQDREEDSAERQRGTQVRLQHYERERKSHERRWHEQVAQRGERLFPLGKHSGKHQDGRDLGDFGRLEPDRAETNPTLYAEGRSGARPDDECDGEQENAGDVRRNRDPLDPAQRDPGEDRERYQRDNKPRDLANPRVLRHLARDVDDPCGVRSSRLQRGSSRRL